MFKELKNEALIQFTIEVDSPLAIKSGIKNVLDPALPDDQVMRQMRDGRMQEVIPGSSLKGVFRSRAEQIFRGLNYDIDDPFDKKAISRKAEGTGKERYEQL
jgi:CRISPR-associated protein Csm3